MTQAVNAQALDRATPSHSEQANIGIQCQDRDIIKHYTVSRMKE